MSEPWNSGPSQWPPQKTPEILYMERKARSEAHRKAGLLLGAGLAYHGSDLTFWGWVRTLLIAFIGAPLLILALMGILHLLGWG